MQGNSRAVLKPLSPSLRARKNRGYEMRRATFLFPALEDLHAEGTPWPRQGGSALCTLVGSRNPARAGGSTFGGAALPGRAPCELVMLEHPSPSRQQVLCNSAIPNPNNPFQLITYF